MTTNFEQMWSDLAPLGRSARSGGYFRQPFTAVDAELQSWFSEECARRGLRVERDGFGNAVAWWDVGGRPEGGRGVLTGSHLDSVLDGGAFDGPLGVVSALAAVDVLRERGFAPTRPVGVGVFREEEGSRFPLACLGSRLASGVVSWSEVRHLRDADGVALADVTDGEAGPRLLADVGTFVELHVEQGRDLVLRDAPVGVAGAIWPHGRYRFQFTGEPNHAGTTRMEDRHDPMLTYAMTVLAANKQARLAGQRATFGRVAVRPNGTNAVPAEVTGWLDARASSSEDLLALVADIERLAVDRAGRDGTDVVVTPESVTGEVVFDAGLAGRIAGPRGWPVIPTAAGHDAGILSGAGIPSAMLFVRNPTGISHSPAETASVEDCLTGVEALADTLAALSRGGGMTSYLLEHAWVDGSVADDVHVVVADGRFTVVGGDPWPGAEPVPGLTIPGLANCHSHAFHRALRGRTQRGAGTFWTWREQMYDLAGRLDPDSYLELATAVYREMAATGITSVGEFHYLHHQPGGTPYDDPNAMGLALVEAARRAGIRIALLDTCYLAAGPGRPAEGVQVRFSDGTAEAWQERADELTADLAGDVVVGAAAHSVRAVPLDDMRLVADWSDRFETPLHVHLSEQVAENEECLDVYGRTPAEVLSEAGALTDRTTVVHATHLTGSDVARIGAAGCWACFCPTTERDLGDGIGPSRALLAAGARLTLGSDSHAVVDLLEEMRALEMDERLAQRSRGHWAAPELISVRNRRRACLARVRRRRPDRGGAARRPRHAGPGHPPHRGRRADGGDGRVRGDRSRRHPGRVRRSGRAPRRGGSRGRRRARPRRPTPVEPSGGGDVTSLLVTGISELVTNDPEHGGPLGVVHDAAVVLEGVAGSPGRGRLGWLRSQTRRTTSADAQCCRASWTHTRTWCSPGTGLRSSRPGWPASATTAAASAPPSPRRAPRPTSSSAPTSSGTSARCAGRGPRPSR